MAHSVGQQTENKNYTTYMAENAIRSAQKNNHYLELAIKSMTTYAQRCYLLFHLTKGGKLREP